MWEAYKARHPKGAGFADPGLPIRLAKTTVLHPAGETHDVTLLWGDKGSETEGTADRDTVPAYNRRVDFDADEEVRIALIAGKWEILDGGGAATSATGCGSCQTVAETLTVPITGGLNAAATYLFIALCGGDPFELEFDSGSTWNGASTQSTNCDGSPVVVTVTMTIAGYLPGQIDINATGDPGGGTVTLAHWENETAFQPGTNTVMRLVSGDFSCLCSPFEPFPCLIPVEPE